MLIFLIVVAGSTSRSDEQEIQNTQNEAEDGEAVFVILPVCDSPKSPGVEEPAAVITSKEKTTKSRKKKVTAAEMAAAGVELRRSGRSGTKAPK